MNFNWLDLVIGGVLFLSFLGALRNGVTKEVIRLIALALGVLGAMWGYQRVAEQITPYVGQPQLAKFAAFAGIVIGCLIAGALIAWILAALWGFAGLRWFDRLLGGAFGLVRGLALATVLVLGIVAFAPVAGAAATVATSRFAPWVLHSARAASYLAPTGLRESYTDGFERVRAVWSESEPE